MMVALFDVRLLRIPVALHVRIAEHSAELLREMYLIAEHLREPDGAQGLPKRLVRLVEELTHRYAGFTQEQSRSLAEAMASGVAELDLHYRVPGAAGEAARHLDELFDEADVYCRQGRHLLTLATPEELVVYRHWYLGEFRRQIGGEAPLSWPDYAQAIRGSGVAS
ncbi:MAG: hypothetical protein IRZ02_06775 [Acidothermus sp.]|nr:hypothetical protein [Acidothermus sp.]MCL6537386.1 hypothetical protein [Acidothermus sp.]